MSFSMVAAGVGAVVGLVGDTAGASVDAENAAKQRQDDRELAMWKTEAGRQDSLWGAEMQREMYGAEAYNRDRENSQNRHTQIAMSMYDRKYETKDRQARYDAFQEQFGDIKENVNNYFRTLSAASVKAQNNDEINTRLAGVDSRLSQTMAERGINPASGISIQALAGTAIAGEVAKVEANRNVETEIAGAKSEYLTAQANDPLLSRAPDFNAGLLGQNEIDAFKSNDTSKVQTTYDIPQQQALPSIGNITKPTTGLSGLVGSIF